MLSVCSVAIASIPASHSSGKLLAVLLGVNFLSNLGNTDSFLLLAINRPFPEPPGRVVKKS